MAREIQIWYYLKNCFWLILPILFWNIWFANELPVSYTAAGGWDDIPLWLSFVENMLRLCVFMLPAFMIPEWNLPVQKAGILLYMLGVVFYFASWYWPIYLPESSWAQSLAGFMAPAYTPLIWLTGIGLIGQRSFLRWKKTSNIYISLSVLFVCFHSLHAWMVFWK